MGKEAAQTKEEMQVIARKNAAARAKKVIFVCCAYLQACVQRARVHITWCMLETEGGGGESWNEVQREKRERERAAAAWLTL